jgi:hypothetical protein
LQKKAVFHIFRQQPFFMMENKLANKLKLRQEEKNLLLQAPETFVDTVREIPFHASVEGEDYDYVQLFVQSQEEVNKYAPEALKAVKEDGKLWFCYPKKSSGIKTDIHRDKGWESVQAAGYGGVAAVSIDDTWSALRFRHKSKVNRREDSIFSENGSRAKSKVLEIPEYLQLVLDVHPQEKAFFESLAYTRRKEWVQWVTEAKREETRQRRLQQMLEMLKEGKKGRYS